jgi:hypothetical protein
MSKIYPLVQKEAVRLEFSRAVEEYTAELKNINREKLFLDFFELTTGKNSKCVIFPRSFVKTRWPLPGTR